MKTPVDTDFNLNVIRTSGVRFLKDLKAEMVGRCFIDDEVYDIAAALYDELDEADEIAKRISSKEYPAVIICWSYHDGMRDGLFRIMWRRGSGEYSDRHHVLSLIRTYEGMCDRAYEAGRFHDSVYIEGYLNALYMLLTDKEGAQIYHRPFHSISCTAPTPRCALKRISGW